MSEEEIVAQRAHRHHSLVWGHAGQVRAQHAHVRGCEDKTGNR